MNEKYYPDARNIIYLSKDEVGEDIHIVKEVTYEDNKYKDNIKIIKDFQRPFYITKKIYRNHVDKKESEEIKRVDAYTSSQSELWNNIDRRLGEGYIGKADVRKLKRSPFIYGADVDSRTYLKYKYMSRDINPSEYRYGVFDIEFDVLKTELILLTISTSKRMVVAILKSYAVRIPNMYKKLNELYDKYIPENRYKKTIKPEFMVFDTELDIIKYIFHEANYMGIDYLSAWGIKYDITTILDILEKYGVDPKDIFHYDKIPDKYKYFKFTPGQLVKKTEAGREIGVNVEEQWHKIKSTTNYILIDAMGTHKQVRVGGASIPGGYSLDNILKFEEIAQKLKFSSNQGFKGIEWHIDMVATKPAEYIIYNIWDVMSMLVLDYKTKDFATSVALLLEYSHQDIFNSGPRRIVDSLAFFYLKQGLVLGVKDMSAVNDKILGLKSWILTLQAHMTTENGLKCIVEIKDLITSIKTLIYDLDQSSGYPSNTRALNVSKDTTHRELKTIEGVSRGEFMMDNINLMYGPTNAVEYSMNLFKLPSMFKILDDYKNNKIKE